MPRRNPRATELEEPYRRYLSATALYHQAAAHAVGLRDTDFQALNLVSLQGSMTPGELSLAVGLTSGATTRLVDRLERAGFVTRATDPADRRRVVVTAVAEPEGLSDVLHAVREDISQYLTGLDDAGLAAVGGYLEAAATAYADAMSSLGARP